MTAVEAQRQLRGHLGALARTIHQELIGQPVDADELDDAVLRAHAVAAAPMCTDAELDQLVTMVREQLEGLGPLEPLLADSSISEVMIVGPGAVWVERDGALTRSEVVVDEPMLRMIIDRVVGRRGVRLDRLVPFADTRLVDGSRAHVTIPPMAIDGPCVTIRRFAETRHLLDDFADAPVAALMRLAVERRANVLVCGPTGSGKTSMLNALGACLPPGERVITIEDAAELRLGGDHVVRLEARPPNAEGVGEITMRTLVRNALRMRPDRLVVGEVRGAEAFDMVQALNTGHRGSLSTCHANSPTDALDRVASMMLMAGLGLPGELVTAQVASAFDLVVATARGRAGARRVTEIVTGSDGEALVHQGQVTPAGRRWVDGHVGDGQIDVDGSGRHG